VLKLIVVLRSLMRHRVRTIISLSAIGFGVIAVLLAGGFIQWVLTATRETTIYSRLGHIQAVRPGYFDSGTADPFGYLLPASSPEFEALSAMPQVKVVAPRLSFSGLISHGESTQSFLGEGVEPDKEKDLSRYLFIAQGESLSSQDPTGVILGEGLAASLGVGIGDNIVLLANTATGGVNAVEAHVRGLFYSSTKAYDDSALRVPLAMGQRLLRVSGAHVWVILLNNTEDTEAVLQALRDRFQRAQLQFVPWLDLADFYKKTVLLFSRQVGIVRLVIALIIVLSISNTLVMSVLERTGEIGTLMALGLRRRKILQLFAAEGILLGLIGGTLGLLIGLALAHVLSAIGIPMPPPPGMNRGFTGEILVTWPLAANAFILAATTTALASLYPAWKASRLVIVDALRHNR
jgi:putative ABC transport system permease protein